MVSSGEEIPLFSKFSKVDQIGIVVKDMACMHREYGFSFHMSFITMR